jgi:hypothetical protein
MMLRTPRLKSATVVLAGFIGLTAVMTWPQVRGLTSRAAPHHDVYFNMWRLEWFAHALADRPARLFDGNIFYPEDRTLALSDAMMVEGVVAAPLIWARLPRVLVHNLMLLGAIALSGAAMFLLVVELTRSRGAGVISGVIFAFAPYRFEHFMHMELQWTMWMPLAFLMLHRTLETGALRSGIATGVLVALQMLSSIYYGIFLGTLIGLSALLLIVADRATSLRRAAVALVAGGALAAVVSAAYAVPYMQTKDAMGGSRSTEQIEMFSARASSYLVATPTNWLYGRMLQSRGRGERRLFPGFLALILATCGLLLRSPSARAIVYLLALVAAFETSLGVRSFAYGFLYDYIAAYRGLRAPARLGIFVVMFLGVLAGYGYVALASALRPWPRRWLLAALVLALLVEYRVTLNLRAYPNTAPEVYQRLSQQPPGVVAEIPISSPAFPDADAEYAYMSTFHWFPLVNGYSGVYPPSYLHRRDRLQHFPDRQSLAQLRADGVRYVILHAGRYAPDVLARTLDDLRRSGSFLELGAFGRGSELCYLYIFR